jgi:hypothetical protein
LFFQSGLSTLFLLNGRNIYLVKWVSWVPVIPRGSLIGNWGNFGG